MIYCHMTSKVYEVMVYCYMYMTSKVYEVVIHCRMTSKVYEVMMTVTCMFYILFISFLQGEYFKKLQTSVLILKCLYHVKYCLFAFRINMFKLKGPLEIKKIILFSVSIT